MLRIVYQLFFLLKNNAVSALLAYAVSILLARELGAEDFGFYSYILVLSSIGMVVVNFATDSTAAVQYAKLGSVGATMSLFLSLRIILYSTYLVLLAGISFSNCELALALFCLSVPFANLSFLFEIEKKNVKYSYIFLFERFLYFSIIFIVKFLFFVDLKYVFFSFLITSLLSLVLQLYLSSEILKKFTFSVSAAQGLIKENVPIVLVALSTLSYGGFSRLLLEEKLGLFSLGIYSAGWQFVKVITIFQAQIDRTWRLTISQNVVQRCASGLIGACISFLCFGTLPVIIFSYIFYVFSEDIVQIIYTEEYLQLKELFVYFAFYFVIINFDGLSRMLWNAHHKKSYYLTINVLAGLSVISYLYFGEVTTIKDFLTIVVVGHGLSVLTLFVLFVLNFKRKD